MATGLIRWSVFDHIRPPWCAVCDKPVEKIQRDLSMTSMAMIFSVYCHGKWEQATLHDEVLLNGRFHGFGKAFVAKPPALPVGAPERIADAQGTRAVEDAGSVPLHRLLAEPDAAKVK